MYKYSYDQDVGSADTYLFSYQTYGRANMANYWLAGQYWPMMNKCVYFSPTFDIVNFADFVP